MDLRDCFWDQVYKEMQINKDIFIITVDTDSFGLQIIKERYPNNVINSGVSEQNAINLACGLAITGKKVVVFGLIPFLTMRAYEQIKYNMCGSNLDITIAGLGPGFSFSWDGPSHHAINDIGLMKLIPELNIWNPITENSMRYSISKALEQGPNYIRIDKGEFPELYTNINDLHNGYTFINKIRPGLESTLVVSSGYMTFTSYSINKEIDRYIDCIDVFRIKPFVKNTCFLSKNLLYLYIIDEHQNTGSFHENIKSDKKIEICIPDKQYFIYGERDYLHKQCGIDKETIKYRIENGIY